MVPRMPRPGGSTLVPQSGSAHDLPAPGKRTLTEQLAPVAPVQRSPAHQAHGPQTATSGVHTPKIALQLRGPEAEHATLAQVERQVKGNFSTQFGRHLRRVAIYKNGVLFAERERLPDGTILRTFPL